MERGACHGATVACPRQGQFKFLRATLSRHTCSKHSDWHISSNTIDVTCVCIESQRYLHTYIVMKVGSYSLRLRHCDVHVLVYNNKFVLLCHPSLPCTLHTHARACTHTHTHARMYTHALTHTHTYTHTHARTHVCTPIHTHTHARTHARTHSRTHTHTHTHTYTHTHTHTYTHTHTHTQPMLPMVDGSS